MNHINPILQNITKRLVRTNVLGVKKQSFGKSNTKIRYIQITVTSLNFFKSVNLKNFIVLQKFMIIYPFQIRYFSVETSCD